jgi:hypothetical protein
LPIGRVFRVLTAVLLLAAPLSAADHRHLTAAAIGEQVIPAFLATTGLYTIAIALIGERLLTRIDGWLAALLLTGPSILLAALPFVPATIAGGIYLNFTIGLLVQAINGYGGCEIAGISTLILRRRYRVYCALNGTDVVERWAQPWAPWLKWTGMLPALLGTVGLFVLLDTVVPTWLENYGYLLFLGGGFAINRLITMATARQSTPKPCPPTTTQPERRTDRPHLATLACPSVVRVPCLLPVNPRVPKDPEGCLPPR